MPGDNPAAPAAQVIHASAKLKARLDAYIPGDDFDIYLELVDNFLVLNGIENDTEKVRHLISRIGSSTSTKIIKALKPKKYSEATFVEVVNLSKTLFCGKQKSIVNHYKLLKRDQSEGESIRDFAIELQSLGEKCKYSATAMDLLLRDKFICGLRNEETRTKMMEIGDEVKFSEVVEKAEAYEHIKRESVAMSDNNQVNNLGGNRGRSRESTPWNQRRRSRERSRSTEEVMCYRCHNKGHFARECTGKRTTKFTRNNNYRPDKHRSNTNAVQESEQRVMDDLEDEFENLTFDEESVNSIRNGSVSNFSRDRVKHISQINSLVLGEKINSVKTALVELQVESAKLCMEVDTGSCVSVCGFNIFNKNFSHLKLVKCTIPLSVVSGERLKVAGMLCVKVKVKRGMFKLRMIVIDSRQNFIPLLGRDWLEVLCPNWRSNFRINAVKENTDLEGFRKQTIMKLKNEFPNVFDDDLTEPIRGFKVDVRMDINAKPFVHKAYNLPFKLRDKVSDQLDQMEKVGIIEKVEYADWASPMVVVVKPNKDLRICFDGSVTINPHIETHHYPLPVIDELLASKSGAKYFCVLDLKGAYQQLIVSDDTKKLLAINTFKGLYAYKRLPFGVKPAATIFQSVMDNILKGLGNVQTYIDDILIWSNTVNELNTHLKLVIERLAKFNVKLNLSKCQWFVQEVKYLGHELSASGISPNQEKVRAIAQAPAPKNVTQLKAFIGMIMFYSKFMPNLNVTLAPLYQLLKKNVHWEWNANCQRAFEQAKQELSSEKLLTHYDPSKPIIVTCDASNDGISGVLSHRVNEREKPVFYVSRTLTLAEKKYPILHREALAIVFAMEKFYKYVYGNHVEIFTDHRPLEGVFGKRKGEPPVIASRLQRYILRLSIFDYSIKYKKGKDIGHADCLSRLPIRNEISEEDFIEQNCFETTNTLYVGALTLNNENLRHAIDKDDCLRKVREYTVNGWRNDHDKKELSFYFSKNNQLTVEDGCLVINSRKIIPAEMKEKVLQVLHANHNGIVKMKQLARQNVYWEGMNEDIEWFVKSCNSCQVLRKDKPKVFGDWPTTTYPFERVHVDFFHFQNANFLIMVDIFSRWIEIKRMSRTNASSLNRVLEDIFATFGFPKELVSDNGPPFNSYEFKNFLKNRGIVLTHSPPYHPQSNGSAERAVQTTKSVLRKFLYDFKDNFQIDKAVSTFLLNNRNTPCTENKLTPSHLLFNFKPRTELSTLQNIKEISQISFSNSENLLKGKEEVQKITLKPRKPEIFENNEIVLYLSKSNGYCFGTRAKIVKRKSEHIYLIEVEGNVKLAHTNQIRKAIIKKPVYGSPSNESITPVPRTITFEQTPTISIDSDSENYETTTETSSPSSTSTPESTANPELPIAQRKTPRTRRPISFYKAGNY